MKPTIKAALVGAIFASCFFIALSFLFPLKVQAAVLGGEQYKIVSPEKFFARETSTPFAKLEEELNRLGADGWKVRAADTGLIILAK